MVYIRRLQSGDWPSFPLTFATKCNVGETISYFFALVLLNRVWKLAATSTSSADMQMKHVILRHYVSLTPLSYFLICFLLGICGGSNWQYHLYNHAEMNMDIHRGFLKPTLAFPVVPTSHQAVPGRW